MSLILLIVVITILILLLFLIVITFLLIKSKKNKIVNKFIIDLKKIGKKVTKPEKISIKTLPMNLDNFQKTVYFRSLITYGFHEKADNFIKKNIIEINKEIKNLKLNTYVNNTLYSTSKKKFIPIHKVDLLITNDSFIIYHPLEPHEVKIDNIKKIIIGWNKNKRAYKKFYLPLIAVSTRQKNYFLLFSDYNDLLQAIWIINLLKIRNKDIYEEKS